MAREVGPAPAASWSYKVVNTPINPTSNSQNTHMAGLEGPYEAIRKAAEGND